MTRLFLLSFSVMIGLTACGDDSGAASDAPAQRQCGGLSSAMCDAADYCAYTHHACGDTDDGGYCMPRPTTCPASTEVCGCDGMTYPSACAAEMAGHDVDTTGTSCQ